MGTLTGKCAVVTGAGSGIGRAIAVRFAAEGASVALLGRREPALDETRGLLATGNHLVLPTDVTREPAVASARDAVVRAWGRVDILVNNAGVARAADPIETPLGEWLEPVDVIFRGAIHCCRAFVPLMPDGGRIVNITSIHRERVEKGASAYAAAKGALTQYTKALALELAPRSIVVNALAPGFVDTPMSIQPDGTNELTSDWFRANYVDGHHLPMRRPGRPDEIAGVALFLAGPDVTYLTGQTITVDGGLTITF